MKFLVVLSCLAVAAYGLTPEVEEKLKQKIIAKAGECKAEVGTSDADIAPIKAHEPPNTPKGKCFVACMNKKFGFQDASGKIDAAGSNAAIEKIKALDADLYGKMKQVTDACLAEVKDAGDECETALNMYTCVCKENKKVGIKTIDF